MRDDIILNIQNSKNIKLPFYTKLTDLKELNFDNLNEKHSISVYTDDNNLYFTFDGPPDETLFVELGGYVGVADDRLKKADEGKVMSREDIENLKALGYIQ